MAQVCPNREDSTVGRKRAVVHVGGFPGFIAAGTVSCNRRLLAVEAPAMGICAGGGLNDCRRYLHAGASRLFTICSQGWRAGGLGSSTAVGLCRCRLPDRFRPLVGEPALYRRRVAPKHLDPNRITPQPFPLAR